MDLSTQNIRTLSRTDFHFPGQTHVYHGKVRDVYTIDNRHLVMIVTDRISAFDVILPRAIPYKGQVLNQIGSRMLDATSDILPNWVEAVPDPNVTIGYRCEPYKIEMVIRGYLTGHAWREYSSGKRILCGVNLPEGMRENEKFPEPILTPTTKAAAGHDQDISREEIILRGIVPEKEYEQLEHFTRALYQRGVEMARKQGLLLVDTKYEFGNLENSICLMDEIHTPDSSRYFYSDGYAERLKENQPQRQLSKEFVRQWLIENNFQGKEGQQVPAMNDEWIAQISARYIELFEKLTGDKFARTETTHIDSRIEKNVVEALRNLK